jgi:hypothetical protein
MDINSFDPAERLGALRAAAEAASFPASGINANMHCHSFFSYNPDAMSPSAIALEGKKRALVAVGLCDFDVLDGLDEFLAAGDILSLKVTANIETRAYMEEFSDVDVNSPGEPGVVYMMGAGFPRVPKDGSNGKTILDGYKLGAGKRNEELVARINAALPEIALDYSRDVAPLTPAGNATERHIVSAYIAKAEERFGENAELARFWAKVLGTSENNAAETIADKLKLEDIVRAKLAKRGGIGYVQPTIDAFPKAKGFLQWVAACDAIPMLAWLDGTTPGESNADNLLDTAIGNGAASLNIIPDRNWNIADPGTKAIKTAKLAEVVEAADKRLLPINVGTELNKAGQPFNDDFETQALKPFKRTFIKGAMIFVGHTVLARFADFAYKGAKASAEFAEQAEMNDFFEKVGSAFAPSIETTGKLRDAGPEKAFAELADMAKTTETL